MQQFIAKTFGGLSRPYYFRHFVFGLLFPAFILWMLSHTKLPNGNHSFPLTLIFLSILNTLLYPYARFVHEGVVGFVLGNNVFFVNAILAMAWKMMTMTLCWGCAIFIAPIGLAYLYFRHSRMQ